MNEEQNEEQSEVQSQEVESPKEQEPKIPEGTEVIGEKVLCSKHGDVTRSLTTFKYLKVEENEKHEKSIQPYTAVFCTQCICDLLFDLQEQGKIGSLRREKQVASHKDAAKIMAYFAKKLKEIKEQEKKKEQERKKEEEIKALEEKALEEKTDENKTE